MTKQGDVIEVILETARQADVTIAGSGPFSPTWSKMNFPLSHFSCCVSLTAPAIAACGCGVAAIGIRILPSETDPSAATTGAIEIIAPSVAQSPAPSIPRASGRQLPADKKT